MVVAAMAAMADSAVALFVAAAVARLAVGAAGTAKHHEA
jgi:hypothetical protein